MSVSNKFSIVKMKEGYYDFYKKAGTPVNVEVYNVAPIEQGSYNYIDSSASFEFVGLSVGIYLKSTATYTLQMGTDLFEAYFDTIDIYFDKQTMEATTVEYFIKCVTSMANMDIKWTGGSNYTFNSTEQPAPMYLKGDSEEYAETGAFGNSSIYYARRNQLHIENININQHQSGSVKFRVEARLRTYSGTPVIDEWKVNSIEILGDGLVVIGESNA